MFVHRALALRPSVLGVSATHFGQIGRFSPVPENLASHRYRKPGARPDRQGKKDREEMARCMFEGRGRNYRKGGGLALTGLLACAAAWTICLPHAEAQTTSAAPQPAGSSSQLEEIVVTAQKRQQNLQVVPVAVTALSNAALTQARVMDVNDLSGLAPNMTSFPSPNGSSVPTITIRGLSSGTGGTAVDTPIALYVDGVYLGRANGSNFDLADIDRVEILRGPQGTLYGRNATGGAINIITVEPKGEFGIKQSLSFGNFAEFRSKTRVDLPEWNGLSAEITYLHDEHDGWVRNLQPGIVTDYSGVSLGHVGQQVGQPTLGARDVNAFHAALRYRGIDDLTLDYKVDYTDQYASQAATQLLAVNPPLLDVYTSLPGHAPISSIFAGYGIVGFQAKDAVANPLMGEEHNWVFGHSLTAAYDATDWLNFKNIVAFREFHDTWVDELSGDNGPMIGGRPFTFLTSVQSQAQHQLSEEFQAFAKTDRVDLIGGVFYFHEVSPWYDANMFASVVPSFVPANFTIPGISMSTNDSVSVYGHATVHVTDQLDITGGARSSWDDRETDDLSETIAGISAANHQVSFHHNDWLVDLTWRPTQDVMAYFKASTGYLSGGVFAGIPFAPETITSYELGSKADLLDKRLRLNGALFHANLENLQQQQYFNGVLQFRNIGSSTIDGAELEVDAIPVPNLLLSGSWGFTNYHYDVFMVNGVNVARLTAVQAVPKTTLHLSAEYDFPEIAWGAVPSFRVDAIFRSDEHFPAVTGVPTLDTALVSPGYWDLGMRASLGEIAIGPATGTISLWGRNLLDERVPSFTLNLGTNLVGQFIQGTTFGADLTITY
jgi:iron complex outermembrane receptor protein